MTEAVVILTTVDSREAAERIATTLVEERLAGCVQVTGPITSVYRWESRVERATEWGCQVKTRQEHSSRVVERIRGLHGYQVPEILVLPVSGAQADYLAWLGAVT